MVSEEQFPQEGPSHIDIKIHLMAIYFDVIILVINLQIVKTMQGMTILETQENGFMKHQ